MKDESSEIGTCTCSVYGSLLWANAMLLLCKSVCSQYYLGVMYMLCLRTHDMSKCNFFFYKTHMFPILYWCNVHTRSTALWIRIRNFFFFFFWFGFYGPFKNISLISSRSFIENRRTRRKTTWPSVSRTWLSHIWPEPGSNHSGEKPNGSRVNSLIH